RLRNVNPTINTPVAFAPLRWRLHNQTARCRGGCWARVGVRCNGCVAYRADGRVLFRPVLVERVLRRLDADIDWISGHRRACWPRACGADPLAFDCVAGPAPRFLFPPPGGAGRPGARWVFNASISTGFRLAVSGGRWRGRLLGGRRGRSKTRGPTPPKKGMGCRKLKPPPLPPLH